MDKEFLSAVDLLKIAAQHAYCAEHLLQQNAELIIENQISIDTLLPISTLMHQAFELTLKAYLLHENRQIGQYKNLFELIELNSNLGLSSHEIQLINTLSRNQAYRKGIDYNLWKNREQEHAFCAQIISLFARILELMPLELQSDYN